MKPATIGALSAVLISSAVFAVPKWFGNRLTMDDRFVVGMVDGGPAIGIDPNDGGAPELVPVMRGNITVQQVWEVGTNTFSSGTRTVTWNTAFSSAPVCVCSTSSAAIPCNLGTIGVTTGVFNGSVSDTFHYQCVGQR